VFIGLAVTVMLFSVRDTNE